MEPSDATGPSNWSTITAASNVKERIAWNLAVGLVCVAMYGPFAVMARYAANLCSVAHCKSTAIAILPFDPGIMPTLALQLAGLRAGLVEAMQFSVALIGSAMMALTFAAVAGINRRWLFGTLAFVCVACMLVSSSVRCSGSRNV